jgi:serine/threonine protein kinase
MSWSEKLSRIAGRELTASEKSCVLFNFSAQARYIGENEVEDDVVHWLFMKIQRLVKTKTRATIVSKYSFDEPVPMSHGQGDTTLQYVLCGSELFCAKIGKPHQIQLEFDIGKRIHEGQSCPTVMPVVDIIAIDELRTAMLTPYYPLSLSSFTKSQPSTVVNMALCALCTVKAFSAKNTCHADIKPGNMMMQSSGRIIVSIDFGSAVAYGESITSRTPLFGLDCPCDEGSLRYDLTCLATSIVVMSTGDYDLTEFPSVSTMRDWLQRPENSVKLEYQIASVCLDETKSIDEIWHTCSGLALPENHAEWIVDRQEIWPSLL